MNSESSEKKKGILLEFLVHSVVCILLGLGGF